MNRLCVLCVLSLGLVASINAYSGVTDSGVTAYRYNIQHFYVIFTDNPADDPSGTYAPLGASRLVETSCTTGGGGAGVGGLICSGTSGDPVDTYTCLSGTAGPPNASNTTWCLFSENPRTGGKAWAVKYVNGLIPTNDGNSIVRCEGTDKFDPENGCQERTPSQMSIEGGYIKLDTRDGSAPPDIDCSEPAHYGRMVVDEVVGTLYICATIGWETVTTD